MKPSIFQWGDYLFYRATGPGAPAVLRSDEKNPAPVRIGSAAALLARAASDYLWVVSKAMVIEFSEPAMRRMLTIAAETGAGLVYADFMEAKGNTLHPHPLNDYQEGSLRDDLNFGPVFLISTAAAATAINKYGAPPADASPALYDLRLKMSVDTPILRIPEFLYRASATAQPAADRTGVKTEAHFAYTALENAARQKKFEKIVTAHLKRIGAYLPQRTKKAGPPPAGAQWKASIIIPVRNRKKTIAEALAGALAQKTDFTFNIIVVDNYSTDGTTGIVKKIAAQHPHVHHLIPPVRGLGIGGCWNEALFSPLCGRYAVQLDSDDLYSSSRTLQKIVDMLREGPYAMVIGSYTLVDENLKTIAPGLIDHREWTQANGHNNLLRVNGMGAPRAFDTQVLRQTSFPNVSYGEDYAVALRLAREYKIGRIFESLYLCRRWSDNTDADLRIEKQNSNDCYKDTLRTLEIKARQMMNRARHPEKEPAGKEQAPRGRTYYEKPGRIYADFSGRGEKNLASLCRDFFESEKGNWPELGTACLALAKTKRRELDCDGYSTTLQYNPARQKSGSAAVDPLSVSRRPCFLCEANRPERQRAVLYRGAYQILCNPAPIFENHFTIVSNEHTPQDIASSIGDMLQIARDAACGYLVFYNGPACGASAPDHLHFQMIPAGALPFLKRLDTLPILKQTSSMYIAAGFVFDRALIVMQVQSKAALERQFTHFLKTVPRMPTENGEPPVNVLCSYDENGWRLTIFLRAIHRPKAFYAAGAKRIFVSPGAIDMAGVIVTPLLKDFKRLDKSTLGGIYREVSSDENTMKKIAGLLVNGPAIGAKEPGRHERQ